MDLGTLGKAKAIAALTESGYDVFNELDGKAPFDLVAHKAGELFRVEVKATTVRSRANTGWEVALSSTRPNRTGNRRVLFSPDRCDLLAVYIVPIDKVLLVDAQEIEVRHQMTIKDSVIEGLYTEG